MTFTLVFDVTALVSVTEVNSFCKYLTAEGMLGHLRMVNWENVFINGWYNLQIELACLEPIPFTKVI